MAAKGPKAQKAAQEGGEARGTLQKRVHAEVGELFRARPEGRDAEMHALLVRWCSEEEVADADLDMCARFAVWGQAHGLEKL